jgi:hypothetical protein
METVNKEEITMAVEQVARGVHRLRRYFELERAERELAAIDYAHNAAARQMEVFAQQLDQEKPMPGRMPISLNAMVQSGKYMWAVAAVRREADLLVGVLCNNTFKEQSPYWNDPLILMMGHEASLDRWRDALDRLNAASRPRQRRKRRSAGASNASNVSPASNGRAFGPETSQEGKANQAWEQNRQSAGASTNNHRKANVEGEGEQQETAVGAGTAPTGADEASTPQTADAPRSGLPERFSEMSEKVQCWVDELLEWHNRGGDISGADPIPVPPDEVVEWVREHKDSDPSIRQSWEDIEGFLEKTKSIREKAVGRETRPTSAGEAPTPRAGETPASQGFGGGPAHLD